jgi:hypothetical protein
MTTTVKHRFVRIGNRIGVWMYRASDGRLASNKRSKVLMITTPGRRTGVLHSTCVRYLDTPEASSSGAPRPAPRAILTGSATCGRPRSPTYRSAPRCCRFGLASCSLKSATLPGRTSCWLRRLRSRSTRNEQAGRSRWHSSNHSRLRPGEPRIDYGITILNTRGREPGRSLR